MKLAFIVFSTFLFFSNSFGFEEDQITSSNENREFPYIQPISIEEAPSEDDDEDGIINAKDECPTTPKGMEVNEKGCELDNDNDGVVNSKDKCPTTLEGIKVDSDGCKIVHDADNDGVADKDDKCPTTPPNTEVDALGCSDADKDGIPDVDDMCPETLPGIVVDKTGCELDSDDDGVVDSKDQCPNTGADFSVDGYGCPQTATLSVTFKSGKYDINNDIVSQLQDFALFLKDNPGYDIVIYGYTDNVGDEEQNRILSQNRADTVKQALTRYGISLTRMTSIGKGEEDPIASNDTPEGRALNRRIEAELIK